MTSSLDCRLWNHAGRVLSVWDLWTRGMGGVCVRWWAVLGLWLCSMAWPLLK